MNYKKIWVEEPWKIVLKEDVFSEKITDPHDVILENKYSHLSAGTEMACVSGIEGWFPLPNVPGYTAVGKILEKGDAVEGFEVGDTVFTFGPHQQIYKINAQDRFHGVCVKIPDGLDPEIASFTHMAGIAITSLRSSNIQLGDVVVVSGLGTIGNLAAQFAQLQGATVVATDINDSRIKIAKDCGIVNTVNTSQKKIDEAIPELTGQEKADCWIDASGQPAVIEDALNHIVVAGEMILLGSPRADYQTNLTKTLQKIHLLEAIKMKSALEFTYPTFNTDFNKHSIERNARIIMDLMNSGKLKIKPFYTHKLKPEQASEAYLGLRDKPAEYVGVVFEW